MDGIGPLPDEDAEEGEYGDEFACAGVQHETSDIDTGSRPDDRGDTGLEKPLSLGNGPLLNGLTR